MKMNVSFFMDFYDAPKMRANASKASG